MGFPEEIEKGFRSLVFLWMTVFPLLLPGHTPSAGATYAWIQDDLDGAFKEAERSGRPLLIEFRCPP